MSILLIGLSALTILSCSEESLTGSQEMQLPSTSGNVMTTARMQAQSKQMMQSPSPQEVSKAFFAMVDKAAAMNASEIDSLSNEEILELGKPILQAFGNTVRFDKATLSKLDEAIGSALSDPAAITKTQHDQTAVKIEDILSRSSSFSRRSYSAQEIRQQLKRIVSTRGPEDFFDCNDYFNQQGDTVFLYYGDNFNLANFICPAGSTFSIFFGTHRGQVIGNSRNGNTWTGFNAILDGINMAPSAFKNGMDNNYINWLTIRNYTQHGILSDGSENVFLSFLTFENIAHDYCQNSDACGQNEGAIMFTNSENIHVQLSDFTNVASGIRFVDSNGPLSVTSNEALNPGRNFFQCNSCTGPLIKINGNSMERTAQFGNTILEDWINIYQSEGADYSWIKVNNNRARGHSNSDSGSFIMLGDAGGLRQEAVGNIGVTPGQVGIGAAGGQHILVSNNKMFGEVWDHANVAFYSQDIYEDGTCNYHSFQNNTANWVRANGSRSEKHSDGSCGIEQGDMDVVYNPNMDTSVWFEW